MKKIALILILVLVVCGGYFAWRRYYVPRHRIANAKAEVKKLTYNQAINEGDLIFQTSLSNQSKAIQLATHSEYSHCGIIFKNADGYYVFEAVQPVKYTPLYKWIARGQNGVFVIKRLKNSAAVLTPETLLKMHRLPISLKAKATT